LFASTLLPTAVNAKQARKEKKKKKKKLKENQKKSVVINQENVNAAPL
jgi:hypothetical protein